jgi:hypothetical protein
MIKMTMGAKQPISGSFAPRLPKVLAIFDVVLNRTGRKNRL